MLTEQRPRMQSRPEVVPLQLDFGSLPIIAAGIITSRLPLVSDDVSCVTEKQTLTVPLGEGRFFREALALP